MNAWRATLGERSVMRQAMEVLSEVRLDGKAHEVAGHLSRGDKRRLELGMCLVQNPQLLLLDEPTAGMSRADTNRTIDLLREIGVRGITMVVIEHDMHVVFSLAERISVMAQGTVIVEDEPARIRGDKRVQDAYLGGAHL
jgi:branched-chain amino acid transport system ATP-binding protein